MSDTYVGECRICHKETDLIYGVCGECNLKDKMVFPCCKKELPAPLDGVALVTCSCGKKFLPSAIIEYNKIRLNQEEKICKHLDGDESYCLMIKGNCPDKQGGYCQDYEEVDRGGIKK